MFRIAGYRNPQTKGLDKRENFMCFKPNRAEGREKLERWEKERDREGRSRDHTPLQTHPRGNQDTDRGDLDRSVERLVTLLGR
jgi:hypothetical protein